MKILSLLLIMALGTSYSITSSADDVSSDPQASSTATATIIASFLESVPSAHFEPYMAGGTVPPGTVAQSFAAAIAAGNHVSANCNYIGRSLLQKCSILIHDGGGEGLAKTHIFEFELGGQRIINGSVRYVIAI